MTYPDELTQIERVKDTTLFIIYDGSMTRAVSGAHLKEFLLAKGFNPASFVSGFIDNEILYMENQEGKEVEIGDIVQFLHNHDIQELRNVPPLEANKLFKVNSTGTGVIYTDKFTLDNNDIQDLRNVPALVADNFAKVTKDGTRIEWVSGVASSMHVENDSKPIGDASGLNIGAGLDVNITNNTANITAKQHERALNTEIITATKTIVAADAGTQYISDTAFNLDDLCILPDLSSVKDGFFIDILHLGSYAKVVNIKESTGAVLLQMQYLDSIRAVKINGAFTYLPINKERKAINLTDKQYADLNYHQWSALPDTSYVMNFLGSDYKNLPTGLTLKPTANYRIKVDLINYGVYTYHSFLLFAQRITISSGFNTDENGYVAMRTGDTFANAQSFGWHVYAKIGDLKGYVTVDTAQEIASEKTFLPNQYFKYINIYDLDKTTGLSIETFINDTLFKAKDGGAGKLAIRIPKSAKTVGLSSNALETFQTRTNGIAICNDFITNTDRVGYLSCINSVINIGTCDSDGSSAEAKGLRISDGGSVELFHSDALALKTQDDGILLNNNRTANGRMGRISTGDGDVSIGSVKSDGTDKKTGIKVINDGSVETYYKGVKAISNWANGTRIHGSSGGDGVEISVRADGTCYIFTTRAVGVTSDKVGIRTTYGGATDLYYDGENTVTTSNNGLLVKNTDSSRCGHILTSGGGVYIGTSLSDYSDPSHNIVSSYKAETTIYYEGSSKFWTSSTGGVLRGNWGGTVTPSSLDLKTNIQPLNGLSKIQLLQPLQWDWSRPEYANENHETIGFSAESYEKVFPELVGEYNPIEEKHNPDSDETDKVITQEEQDKIDYFKGVKGVKKAITSMKMDALVVDAIQQLAKDNHGLRLRIEALESALKEIN